MKHASVVALLTVLPALVYAGPVRVDLVADTASIASGASFTLAVRFKIDAGHHIYWVHPGDSGIATEVEWQLPEGFTAGPLQWPIPDRFKQPGDAVGYGYAGEVWLLSTVTPPVNPDRSAEIVFGAKVNWLDCFDTCVPGAAETSIHLPFGVERVATHDKDFNAWRKRLPVPADELLSDYRYSPPTGERSFDQELSWVWRHGHPSDANWFPAPGPGVRVDTGSRVIGQSVNQRVAIHTPAKLKSDWAQGLVVRRDADGSRRAAWLRFRIVPAED